LIAVDTRGSGIRPVIVFVLPSCNYAMFFMHIKTLFFNIYSHFMRFMLLFYPHDYAKTLFMIVFTQLLLRTKMQLFLISLPEAGQQHMPF
jgi:hypothetical protein